MKRNMLYISLGVAILILAFIVPGLLQPKEKSLDERITLRIKDKIPYGMYVAYTLLPKIFSNAIISQMPRSLPVPFPPS